VQNLAEFAAASFDVFYSIYVLNHVRNDGLALQEIRRVLRPGGIAVIMVPLRLHDRTTAIADQTITYGREALEKYGVGSYRYYGMEDFLAMLAAEFDVAMHTAADPVTGQEDTVFLCRPKSFCLSD
jgi:ubiquinone/menaquinone biosynthesis C-methylase UbiE